jgi:hypothetical protein
LPSHNPCVQMVHHKGVLLIMAVGNMIRPDVKRLRCTNFIFRKCIHIPI